MRGHAAPVLLIAAQLIEGFRIVNVTDKSQLTQVPPAVFGPYAKGFVGYYGDPDATFFREHINSGAIFNPEVPAQWNDITISQRCPGMVGPFSDGEYYCVGKEYGFCDQRSSTCWCNKGYQGLNCTQCIPEYYMQGALCYPRKKCPNDCSGQGNCDFSSGICTCNPHRTGLDCSQQLCLRFDPLCTSCDSDTCLECSPGFFPSTTNTCVPCTKYDPRCISCDANKCLACGDFILNSVRRSGARDTIDPVAPPEEVSREFSFQFVYGSQQPQVFDDAEPYTLVSSIPPGQSCIQGNAMDNSWKCSPLPQSHVVCGHSGTLFFSSPAYAVNENDGWIPIKIVRTGGGAGYASVVYELIHVTTSNADVSATAFYTSTQRLVFAPGVVELTFFVTIHDNFIWNEDKVFKLALRGSSPGSTIGNQGVAVVTILENDPRPTPANIQIDGWGTAGVPFQFQVTAASSSSTVTPIVVEAALVASRVDNDIERTTLVSTGNVWKAMWTPTRSGDYNVSFLQLFSSGLQGYYYENPWLQGRLIAKRVDRTINFTWSNEARWAPFHYGSARWKGYLQALASELTYFRVNTTGKFRLWLNEKLLIDTWLSLDSQNWGAAFLQKDMLYSIQLDYRHGNAPSTRLNLQWESASFSLRTISTQNLFVPQLLGTRQLRIVPGLPSQVAFQGNFSGVAGFPFSYTFDSMDAFRNIRRQRENVYRSVLTVKSNANINADVAIEYDPLSMRQVAKSLPVISGLYSVHLYLDQVEVLGFPTDVLISPSPFAGPRSVVSGPGISANGVIAATTTSITIQAKDIYGNWMAQGGGQFQVQATSIVNSLVDLGTVVDNKDGTYTAIFTPRFSGAYSVQVYVNKIHVAQSPYQITVSPNQPYGPSCHYVAGAGIYNATTGLPATFTIQLRDINSNLITSGSANVVVTSNLTFASSSCTNTLNGQYSCTYIPTIATQSMVLNVLVNSKPIRNSPFIVQVVTGIVSGSSSVANGTGLLYSNAGQLTLLNIQAKDIYGNNRMANDALTAVIQFANLTTATGINTSFQYFGNGYYEFTYLIKIAGVYILRLLANGQDIVNSPFTITIYPVVADCTTTVAYFVSSQPYIAGTTLYARIEPKDIYGNPVNSIYQVDLDPPNVSVATNITPALVYVSINPTQAQVYTFQPRIYLPGGGNLTVFSSSNWTGTPTLRQSFVTLGADYGLHMPSLTDSMRQFSVTWSGFISASYTEYYSFNITLRGCKMLVFLNDAVVLNMTSSGIGSFSASFTAGQMVSLQLWWSKINDGPTFYNITWSSLSQQSQNIPPSALFSLLRVTSLLPTFTVVPNVSFPANFELINAPSQWTAGTPVALNIVARDAYGNYRYQGGDNLQLYLSGYSQPPINSIVQSIQDYLNGSYLINVVCFTSGNLSLTLGIKSQLTGTSVYKQFGIRSSPFSVTVLPASPSIPSTTLSGNGLLSGMAGVSQYFTAILRDAYLNVLPGPQNLLKMSLVLTSSQSVSCSWTYDATAQFYNVTCVPLNSGKYSLKIELGSVIFSPTSIQPTVLPNLAVAATSQIINVGQLLHPINELHSFTVALADAYSNQLQIGGDHVSVVLRGAGTVVATVVDLLSGIYRVDYSLSTPGLYETTVLLMQPTNSRGLVGSYFANVTTLVAESQRVDSNIDFVGLANPKVVWTGFLLGTFTEQFKFYLTGVQFILDGVEVVDGQSIRMEETRLYPVRLECIHSTTAQLSYQSDRTPRQIVPSSVLFPTASEISPRLRITGV
ncbi:hypothetical protein Ae201684_018673 [Aphanomyces euteiches]|uniref:PA14 domain-containing protein n=1 Tax=Aphanomyces euteiches TaxID=100861 RepID=A0A6G0W536_9STRA|nr:hypothetical protein Ae201684_018673 [Aphanomyces euteiches]